MRQRSETNLRAYSARDKMQEAEQQEKVLFQNSFVSSNNAVTVAIYSLSSLLSLTRIGQKMAGTSIFTFVYVVLTV
jgi:hypothetical protein